MGSKEFGKWIKQQRARRKISQKELTFKLGYKNAQFLNGVEHGCAPFPIHNLSRLARSLKVKEDEVVDAYVSYYRKLVKEEMRGAKQ